MAFSYLRLPHDLFILIFFMFAMITSAILYNLVITIVLNIIAMVFNLYIIMLLHDQLTLASAIIFLDVVIIVGKIIIDGLISDYRVQYRIADQSRWTATKFATANIRLRGSVSRSNILYGLDEKTKIAREIHDTVGYSLTAILIKLRTARELVILDINKVCPILNELEEIVQSAIGEVRKAVHDIGDSLPLNLSWVVRWRQICNNFADYTGTRLQLSFPEDLQTVDNDTGEAIFFILQEALTNSIRHGRASYVAITLLWEKEEQKILLLISDDGLGAENVAIGFGLKGIRERVEGLRGQVAWNTLLDKGFDLGIELPFRGEE